MLLVLLAVLPSCRTAAVVGDKNNLLSFLLDDPSISLRSLQTTAITKCSSSSDCSNPDFFYCAAGTCREHGMCSTVLDCQNPSNLYFLAACVGFLTCVNGSCGIECADTPCPPGVPYVEKCSGTSQQQQQPCEIQRCGPTDQCVNDFCGATCRAIFIDLGGHQVCGNNQTNATTLCVTDQNCSDGQVCSATGECIEAPTTAPVKEDNVVCPCDKRYTAFMSLIMCRILNLNRCLFR
jgi:hypothetical protein